MGAQAGTTAHIAATADHGVYESYWAPEAAGAMPATFRLWFQKENGDGTVSPVALDVHNLDRAVAIATASATAGVDFLEVGDQPVPEAAGVKTLLHGASRRATGDDKDKAVKELTGLLQKLFDLREENRVQEVAELKRRVEALEKAIEGRKANKDKIVEKRARELLGERLDDEW